MKKLSMVLLVSVFIPCVAMAGQVSCPHPYHPPGTISNGNCYYSNDDGKTCYEVTCNGNLPCGPECNRTGAGAVGVGGGENKVGSGSGKSVDR